MESITHDDVLNRVGNTPLVKLNSLSKNNIEFFAKLEGHNPFGSVKDTRSATTGRLLGTSLLNLDVSGFNNTGVFDVYLVNASAQIVADGSSAFNNSVGSPGSLKIANNVDPKSLTVINGTAATGSLSTKTSIAAISDATATNYVGMVINHQTDTSNTADTTNVIDASQVIPIAVDFFSFGFTDDGAQASERVANQIIRIEVEETGDNTGVFEGSLEYVMVNQLNIYVEGTYSALDPIDDSPIFLVIEDLTDEDAPRVNYLDLGADGVSTQVADQQEAPTHSGVVSLDNENYKVADTVTVTLEDSDLNTDSELIDIYTVVNTVSDVARDTVGKAALPALSWVAISIGLQMILPFPYGLIAALGIFIAFPLLLRRRYMNRMGGAGGSSGTGTGGFFGMGNPGSSAVKYVCLVCNNKHKGGTCPRCGSKMQRADF
jgi:hypothetical protein